MDRNGPCMSRGSIILWIRKEEPSGGGVDGSRRLGGREDGDGKKERIGAEVILFIQYETCMDRYGRMDRIRAAASSVIGNL